MLRLPKRPDWWDDAACKDAPLDVFFPGPGQSTKEARRICSLCTVITECNEAAMEEAGWLQGVFAGMTQHERRKEAAWEPMTFVGTYDHTAPDPFADADLMRTADRVRRRFGLSRHMFAKALKVSDRVIRNYENGLAPETKTTREACITYAHWIALIDEFMPRPEQEANPYPVVRRAPTGKTPARRIELDEQGFVWPGKRALA